MRLSTSVLLFRRGRRTGAGDRDGMMGGYSVVGIGRTRCRSERLVTGTARREPAGARIGAEMFIACEGLGSVLFWAGLKRRLAMDLKWIWV